MRSLNNSERKKAMGRQLSLMDKGFRMGKIKIKHRSELYGRK